MAAAGDRAADAAATVTAVTSPHSGLQWMLHGAKEYLFVIDELRQLDLSRDAAAKDCSRRADDASLVTVDDEDELEFVTREIRRRVTAAGQEFAHEQWWTAGRARGGRWVWDVRGYPQGTHSASYILQESLLSPTNRTTRANAMA